MNDVVRLFDRNAPMLRGLGFDRRAPGVFEKAESEDVTWRIVALPDRKDEPYLAEISVGTFLPSIERFLEDKLPLTKRPGSYCADLVTLAGRGKKWDPFTPYDLRKFRRMWWQPKTRDLDIERRVVEDLATLVEDVAMNWLRPLTCLPKIAEAWDRELSLDDYSKVFEVAELGALWWTIGDSAKAEAMWSASLSDEISRSYTRRLKERVMSR